MGLVSHNKVANNSTPYRFGYQGQYAEQDTETGWHSFELRQYDARIGRWMTIDPAEQYWSPYVGMGNDWVNLSVMKTYTNKVFLI